MIDPVVPDVESNAKSCWLLISFNYFKHTLILPSCSFLPDFKIQDACNVIVMFLI